jgi:hypothetical protein
MADRAGTAAWAREEFGDAELGDARRTYRLVRMANRSAMRPAGRVLEVFSSSAERQGAYDFLENHDIDASAVAKAMYVATSRRCAEDAYVFVSVDGSSLTLSDRRKTKDFGAVGSTRQGACGLKVVSAYAVSSQGVPLGILSQIWWSRAPGLKRNDCHARPLEEKETQHWVDAMDASIDVLAQGAPTTQAWFVLDREGDKRHCLEHVDTLKGHRFTIRSSYNRRLSDEGDRRCYMLDELRRKRPIAVYELDVASECLRKARRVRMELRATKVTLRVAERRSNRFTEQEVHVVEARERGTPPRGEKRIEWRLLTNHPVHSGEDARLVVFSYSQRWRIEEFHKTWKSGACNVERCQLRAMKHVIKWATIMAAVASRIERIKVLSRTEPELPASSELSRHEIRALVLLKREHKKRTETIPDGTPTIAQAALWLAELGGYTGAKSSGGPPGSITIRRGFDQIAVVATALKRLEAEGKLR